MSKRSVLTTLVFVAGCSMGGAAAHLVVPFARAGTNAPRWEYACAPYEGDRGASFNALGAEGWEMAAAFGGGSTRPWLCFKRPLP